MSPQGNRNHDNMRAGKPAGRKQHLLVLLAVAGVALVVLDLLAFLGLPHYLPHHMYVMPALTIAFLLSLAATVYYLKSELSRKGVAIVLVLGIAAVTLIVFLVRQVWYVFRFLWPDWSAG